MPHHYHHRHHLIILSTTAPPIDLKQHVDGWDDGADGGADDKGGAAVLPIVDAVVGFQGK